MCVSGFVNVKGFFQWGMFFLGWLELINSLNMQVNPLHLCSAGDEAA